jgi:hypothetical protein
MNHGADVMRGGVMGVRIVRCVAFMAVARMIAAMVFVSPRLCAGDESEGNGGGKRQNAEHHENPLSKIKRIEPSLAF